MRKTMMLAGAAALAIGPMTPAGAQPADTMARPVPLPQVQPDIQPAPLPNRPNRPNRPGGSGQGNNGGNQNNNWNNDWNGGGWNGETIRCESREGRRNTCRADTRGGVRLVRQLSNSPCREGRTWGWSSNSIWVDNGCRGDFQLRSGSGQSSGGGGPSAAAIIGGVAVAGGLIALLSQSGKSNSTPPANTTAPAPPPPQAPALPAAPAGPARIEAAMGGVTPDARPSLQTCLNEAARQIGATGGTEIRLDRLDDIEKGNGGFRFRFQLIAVYPDETRTIQTFCRATPTRIVELSFG